MKHLNKYIEALNKGSEIVIINDDPDFNDDRFLEHIEELETEGVRLFIRGYEEW